MLYYRTTRKEKISGRFFICTHTKTFRLCGNDYEVFAKSNGELRVMCAVISLADKLSPCYILKNSPGAVKGVVAFPFDTLLL